VALDVIPNFMSPESKQRSTGIPDVGIGHDGALSIGDLRGVRRDTHVWRTCGVTDADNGSYIMI
jgi:hypothetical protein